MYDYEYERVCNSCSVSGCDCDYDIISGCEDEHLPIYEEDEE